MGDKKYTLSLCMIVKNEADNLTALWQSVKHIVDEWILVDTGSTDKTVEVATKLGAKVFETPGQFQTVLTAEHAEFFKKYGMEVKAGDSIFEFAEARNFSFSKATKDFILWLDADDILVGSDRLVKIINSNLDPLKQIGIHLLYKYELDQYLNPIVEHYRERVLPNNGSCKWQGRIHEIIVPAVETEYVRVVPHDCHVLHNSGGDRKAHSGERNIKALLLDLFQQGDKPDPRTLFFLAESLKIHKNFDKAAELYDQYLKLSGWDEEKCLAAVRACGLYLAQGDAHKALDYAYRALRERPDFPMAYSALAQVYYTLEDYTYAERYAKEALNSDQPDTLVMVDEKYNKFIPLYILADMFMRQGNMKDALGFCREAMKFEPLNEDLLKIQYTCENLLKESEIAKSLKLVTDYLRLQGELEKARQLLITVPTSMTNDPRVNAMRTEIQGEIKVREQGWVSAEKRIKEGQAISTEYKLLLTDLKKFRCESVLLVSNEPLLAAGLKNAGFKVKRVVKFDEVTQKYDAVFFDHNLQMIEDRGTWLNKGIEFAKRAVMVAVPNRDPKAIIQTSVEIVEEWLKQDKLRIWNLMPLREGVIYASALVDAPKKSKITFFCGGTHTEAWGPLSHVEGGCGGSEEAVIYLTRELAALNHPVEVINSFPHPCYVDGVQWRNVSALVPNETFDTLILWRVPHYLEMFQLGKANRTLLWLHDVPEKYWFTKDRLEKIDKIICLSNYHRTLLPDVPDEKFIISQNGVDIRQFDQEVVRNPKRVVYTSSYDRGLEHLLHIWPAIVSEIPDAELHVYYGWGTFNKLRTEEKHREWKSWMMTQMRDLKGVKEHGRVDQVTLAKEMLTSGVFAYPCHFEEISCISAMKAQVAGCTPLTTNYSALAETNLCELYKIDGNPKASEEVIEKFKTKLLEVLKTPMTDDQRIELSGLAMHKFSWKNVAKEWSKFCQEAK